MRLLKYALLLIFYTSSLASIWVFVDRVNLSELEYQSASYGDVYGLLPSGPRLSGFSYQGTNLTIKIENIGHCAGWRIKGPKGLEFTQNTLYPTFSLLKGQNEYEIGAVDCENPPVHEKLIFDVLRVPQANVTSDIVSQDVVRLMNMPLVFSLRPGADLDRWTPPIEDFGKQDVQRARDFLAQHGVDDSIGSLEKVARIRHALSSTLPDGNPPEYLNYLSPMEILDEALSGRAKVFCRQRALIQVFLSNVAGVPSRIVGSGRVLDGVMLSGHGFLESYISEQSRWAYSDISHGISYIPDRDGHVVNAADVLSVISIRAGQGVQVCWSVAALPVLMPWSEVQTSLEPWYNKNATLMFWPGHDRAKQQIDLPFLKKVQYRLQRYLFEPSLYLGYQRSYNLHWLRSGLILTSIISGLMLAPLICSRNT